MADFSWPSLFLIFFPSPPISSSPPQSLSFLSHIPAGRSVSCDVTGRVCVSPDALPYKDPICAGPTCKHTPSKNIHPVAPHSSLPVEERSLTPAPSNLLMKSWWLKGGDLPPSSSHPVSDGFSRTLHPCTSKQDHRIKVIIRNF